MRPFSFANQVFTGNREETARRSVNVVVEGLQAIPTIRCPGHDTAMTDR